MSLQLSFPLEEPCGWFFRLGAAYGRRKESARQVARVAELEAARQAEKFAGRALKPWVVIGELEDRCAAMEARVVMLEELLRLAESRGRYERMMMGRALSKSEQLRDFAREYLDRCGAVKVVMEELRVSREKEEAERVGCAQERERRAMLTEEIRLWARAYKG